VRRIVLLLAGLLAGCLGGVRPAELSDAPIAFSYRTPEEARRRAEDLLSERERGREPARASRPGYGEVTLVEAARRGSIPLAWSRDHRRLLFAQPGDQDFQIYEFEREERTVRPVTHGPRAHTQACYAPEDRLLVVVVDTRVSPPRSQLAISGRGGRRPFRTVTEGPADHSPTCAPEADRAVFVRELGRGRAELWSLRLDDPEAPPQRLAPGQHPSFSRDGEWLAFAAPHQRELRIWRMRPDGSGRAPIGRGIRHEARPTLSPDGRMVAYVAAEDAPRRHLYLRRFDGSGDRILFADGDGEYPVW
jgi:Tol biopolymer transport system component